MHDPFHVPHRVGLACLFPNDFGKLLGAQRAVTLVCLTDLARYFLFELMEVLLRQQGRSSTPLLRRERQAVLVSLYPEINGRLTAPDEVRDFLLLFALRPQLND